MERDDDFTNVEIIGEYGFEQALHGLGYSYGLTSGMKFREFTANTELFNKVHGVSKKLYNKEEGHNKFLESIYIWLDINEPRYLHSEIDTYRISSKQSQSTMHTMHKRPLTQSDFQYDIPEFYLEFLNEQIDMLNKGLIPIEKAKNYLPEGFMQSRVWVLNYKTMRNVIKQRIKHKLPQWKYFCEYMLSNLEHHEFFEDIILRD